MADNSATWLSRPRRSHDESAFAVGFKTTVAYPVRDWVTFTWLGRAIVGDPAWNVGEDGTVADSSFFVDRHLGDCPIDEVARGACTGPPPQPPFELVDADVGGGTPKVILRDALGRTFFVKPDDPAWSGLGSSASVISSRILWALGYHVPAIYPIILTGTGRADLDGRRASAALAVPGDVCGHFKFDWFRLRREFRGLRLACAWLNDTDRVDTNTLVTVVDGQARYYLIDVNSTLGSWQGRPKPAWRGWRYWWDVEWQLAGALTFGLARPGYDPDQPIVSEAIGRFDARFDPRTWRPQFPSTAFDRMTDADARWMTARIAALGPEQLRAIVAEAGLDAPSDADYLLEILLERRRMILETWPAD
ncbi:MAG: hypothetical protein JXA69_13540 [Phycisphaerae bacterium]|nr:hypothetical protein [Phycisphaerae bacterium]